MNEALVYSRLLRRVKAKGRPRGKAYIFLLDRYAVRRHEGYNLVEIREKHGLTGVV
ncbi:MAG: hypothetical protein ACE147_07770 [Candidatus Methylomirabilales bacterium]